MIRRWSVGFALFSAVYWLMLMSFAEAFQPMQLIAKHPPSLWSYWLLKGVPGILYAIICVLFCHRFAKRVTRDLSGNWRILDDVGRHTAATEDQAMGRNSILVPVRNHTEKQLGIMLEPWTDSVELEPGQSAELSFKLEDERDLLEIDFSENFLALWVPPGATIKLSS